MVWIGIYPKPIFDMIDKPVEYVMMKVDPGYYGPRVASSRFPVAGNRQPATGNTLLEAQK